MTRAPGTTIHHTQDTFDFFGSTHKSFTGYAVSSNDWLDLSKIEAGKVEIQPTLVDCQDMLDEVAHTLRPLAEAKRLHFEVLLPITKVTILTDYYALRQILLHLTHNAIKFTQAGSICIELRRRLESSSGKISTAFSVEDTGLGIRPEELTRLFQARWYTGPRLGLYVSQKLAGLLGGRIEAMSMPGKGSIFRLVILGK